jgi:response regulator RpfG family c-di-GMP phosphodiesterase/serine/threonine protein kinase
VAAHPGDPHRMLSPTIEYSPRDGLDPSRGVPPVLRSLLERFIVLPEEWEELPEPERAALSACEDTTALLARLSAVRLLTPFQSERLLAGRVADLRVGHYRLLEPIGRGGMGEVYRAEHVYLRVPVAIKILADGPRMPPTVLSRFYAEARVVARLRHPNIVACHDAGEHVVEGHLPGVRHFYVMDYIAGGQDLEALVRARGALPPDQAARIARQCAEALAEAHRHGLVHRDIKPSNVLLAPDGRALLLDFGLARQPRRTITEAGVLLGTVGYMAPEQARDAHTVDGRADVYGLGGVLFWCLTGRDPFPESGVAARDLARRLTLPPPSARQLRPGVPAELDALLTRMLAAQPDGRPPSATAVALALTPHAFPPPERVPPADTDAESAGLTALVVDDEPGCRTLYRRWLEADGVRCAEAADAASARTVVESLRVDFIILDFNLPDVDGGTLMRWLRSRPATAEVPVLLVSGQLPPDELAGSLLNGAADVLLKPFSLVQFRCRVRAALSRGHDKQIAEQLWTEVEQLRAACAKFTRYRGAALADGRQSLVAVISKMLTEAGLESPHHLRRLPLFVRRLAEAASAAPGYAPLAAEGAIDDLAAAAALHDVGKLGLPAELLRKPGRFDADERLVVQTHTTCGDEVLRAAAAGQSEAPAFLALAAEVARHHHEHWDGSGYPDGLTGAAIPPAARLVALADMYDALRSRRPHRPGLAHGPAVRYICEEAADRFDPTLVAAFQSCAADFDRIFREHTDR